MSARVVAKLVQELILCQRRPTRPIKVEDSQIKKNKSHLCSKFIQKKFLQLGKPFLLKVIVMQIYNNTYHFIDFSYFRFFFYSNTQFVLILLKLNEKILKYKSSYKFFLKSYLLKLFARMSYICLQSKAPFFFFDLQKD